MDKIFQYYVEGKTDYVIVKSLMKLGYINNGKIEEFKVLEKLFKNVHIRTLKMNTVIVLIFDTDVKIVDKLKENTTFLSRQSNIKEVICIPQVENLEDELVRSCKIKKIEDLLDTTSSSEFKKKLLNVSNVCQILKSKNFDMNNMWKKQASKEFKDVVVCRERIIR